MNVVVETPAIRSSSRSSSRRSPCSTNRPRRRRTARAGRVRAPPPSAGNADAATIAAYLAQLVQDQGELAKQPRALAEIERCGAAFVQLSSQLVAGRLLQDAYEAAGNGCVWAYDARPGSANRHAVRHRPD
jgi:hypothetical protein